MCRKVAQEGRTCEGTYILDGKMKKALCNAHKGVTWILYLERDCGKRTIKKQARRKTTFTIQAFIFRTNSQVIKHSEHAHIMEDHWSYSMAEETLLHVPGKP